MLSSYARRLELFPSDAFVVDGTSAGGGFVAVVAQPALDETLSPPCHRHVPVGG